MQTRQRTVQYSAAETTAALRDIDRQPNAPRLVLAEIGTVLAAALGAVALVDGLLNAFHVQ